MKYQISASLAFVRGIHRWPVDSRVSHPASDAEIFQIDDVDVITYPYHNPDTGCVNLC